jgi:hypothetical protein
VVSDKIQRQVIPKGTKYFTVDNSVLSILQGIVCSSTHAACVDGAGCVRVVGSRGS